MSGLYVINIFIYVLIITSQTMCQAVCTPCHFPNILYVIRFSLIIKFIYLSMVFANAPLQTARSMAVTPFSSIFIFNKFVYYYHVLCNYFMYFNYLIIN